MKKSLSRTLLQGPNSSEVEIKVGDKVCFINPETLKDSREKRKRTELVNSTISNFGSAPYNVLEITHYSLKKNPLTTLTITNKERNIEMNKKYFTKV